MKYAISLLLVSLLVLCSSCQLTSQNKNVTKEEAYKEFENGSNIQEIPVDKQTIENLQLLGLVWGFLKYYHPSVAEGKFNWDHELFLILPRYIQAKKHRQRDALLVDWINGLGSFRLQDNNGRYGNAKMLPDLDWISTSGFSYNLKQVLTNVQNAERTGNNYYVNLHDWVSNPVFKNEDKYLSMSDDDAGMRLLSLFRYWNIIQYYFPYKYLIEEDWKNVLSEFIPKFINSKDKIAYTLTVLELITRVNDTHANIYGNKTLTGYFGKNNLSIQIKFIENKAVIAKFLKDEVRVESGLKPGDVIVAVNQKPVEQIIREQEKITPASNYETKLRNISYKLFNTNDSNIVITYKRDNVQKDISLKTEPLEAISKILIDKGMKDTCFKILKGNIAYVYPGTIKDSHLRGIKKGIKGTKGLIIDLRCYPSEFIVFSFGQYLVPKPTEFVKFTHGDFFEPGLFTFKANPPKVGQLFNPNYYKNKVVILINEATQSQAEYTTMAFRTAPKSIVVGSTTAGADGNISPISLPGNLNTVISGIGVYYPDGRETQRVGIVPDIEVRPTITGIRQGRDELVEKAIELINQE